LFNTVGLHIKINSFKWLKKMANNKGAVIFLAVIAVGALGISGFMFITDLLSNDVDESENFKLVALWDNINENTSYAPYTTDSNFLIEYFDQMVLNPEYITVYNNTRFSFATLGLYKINLNTIFEGIVNTADYWAILIRNSSNFRYFDRWEDENNFFHYTDSSLYINVTNSDTIYGIIGWSDSDDFGIASSAISSQLSIEYVVP